MSGTWLLGRMNNSQVISELYLQWAYTAFWNGLLNSRLKPTEHSRHVEGSIVALTHNLCNIYTRVFQICQERVGQRSASSSRVFCKLYKMVVFGDKAVFIGGQHALIMVLMRDQNAGLWRQVVFIQRCSFKQTGLYNPNRDIILLPPPILKMSTVGLFIHCFMLINVHSDWY